MSGYIGSKASVTQVDGYNRTEADSEFVQVTGDTMTGNLDISGIVTADALGIGTSSPDSILDVRSGANPQVVLNNTDGTSNDSHDFRIGTFGGSTPYWSSLSLDASSHTFKSYGAERMRIASSGVVTTPNQPLLSANSNRGWITMISGGFYGLGNSLVVNRGGFVTGGDLGGQAVVHVPASGHYRVCLHAYLTSNQTGRLHVQKNGSTGLCFLQVSSSSVDNTQYVENVVYLTVNDYLNYYVLPGSNITAYHADQHTYVTAEFLG